MSTLPFDHVLLDEQMEAAGLDALFVTSKHNIQYLLGGHRFFFFDYMDAIGVSRYLPILLYFRGDPQSSVFIGNVMESWQLDNAPVWVPSVETTAWGSLDATESAIAHLKDRHDGHLTVGYEQSFLPADAFVRLSSEGTLTLTSAEYALERLRACKSPAELELLERASIGIVDSMRAVFEHCGAGSTKNELLHQLRVEETNRGMIYEYCLASMGSSHNRGPSDQVWKPGDVLCLDSGGNLAGYIGDLARMAVAGEPDQELKELLAEIEDVQLAARKPIKAGAIGQSIFDAAHVLLDAAPHRNVTTFVAHGMGLISHEAPRLTSTGPVPYPDEDGPKPLMEGMVLSIETTMLHPRRGFIKLEDTVIVCADGHRAFGDENRGWNVASL